ncbi:hypothetical protein MMC18_007543 [Xylographa bjoerkii]|nr:hypothetical protein [Xylographa bjoerkii]
MCTAAQTPNGPSLIVFGAQTTQPTTQYLTQLRGWLLQEHRLQAFLAAIKGLPALWQTLIDFDPGLQRVPGHASLTALQRWVEDGDLIWMPDSPPNVLSSPMTIIIHIVQYFHYLSNNTYCIGHPLLLQSAKLGGVQGFCTGLLSAIAIACSKDEDMIGELAAVALRLAVCIGAYIDADGAFAIPPNEISCFVVRWKSNCQKDVLHTIIARYPDAYVSVISDATSATITSFKSSFSLMIRQLIAEGLIVKSIDLQGRFHGPFLGQSISSISRFCETNRDFQLPTAEHLQVPMRSNSDGKVVTNGPLLEFALRSIMGEVANWHLTISAAISQLLPTDNCLAVSIGVVDAIPSSAIRNLALSVARLGDTGLASSSSNNPGLKTSVIANPFEARVQDCCYPESAIAVVGMASMFPGADTLEEFWSIINSGTSMLQEVPLERFSAQGHRRNLGKRFWGNFIRDVDAFDHRFFKRSAREAASMDPQQRLLLQVAYQALESSGYFGNQAEVCDDIGCYLGICATDYDDNISSHNPTAFSSVGTLRAFLTGRISHFFGWTGPSITYDTACSSSAVAIDAACKAINFGECSSALAGGATIFTSPYFFQNLAAASFLSSTGASKPFDAKADGYCRGEGVGLVFLKKLSVAIAKGDDILGVIAATAVNQNSNTVSITVPHSPSQIRLYQKVTTQAGVKPTDISYVEAHGTGTTVGDPLEFESIRKVFGGSHRVQTLNVASVKGNIGHTEGASGVAALIKTVLMMQHNTIPMQANFTALNPKIDPLESDQMAIPRVSQQWNAKFKVACINNYGASGSNAAIILCQPPLVFSDRDRQKIFLSRYPIFLSANSPVSLKSYCIALRSYLARLSPKLSLETLLPSLAFNLAKKQNCALPQILTTTATTLADLDSQLALAASGSNSFRIAPTEAKPTVLVFGGQTSNNIGLSKGVYDSSVLLRSYLNHCDEVIRSLGHSGLYPTIFQDRPVESIVMLHYMLFSLQYSCAKAWIESGLQIKAVIGHSFGQLTALTISGSLSLKDGLKLVIGRAFLMQTHWGPERGSMISLEANIDTVVNVVSLVEAQGHKLEIACYNGPMSHVLVGTESAVKAIEQILASSADAQPIQYKRLKVTHGFHSEFTDPLLPGLSSLSERLNFQEPSILLETCSDGQSWTRPVPNLIAEHTRTPVYFGQAVERLVQRLGRCTWLEAGSGSTVTSMVRRALGVAASPHHTFCAVQLGGTGWTDSLAEITIKLWNYGHKVQFWPFHQMQRSSYSQMTLPPYQFEKSRHWLEWVDRTQETSAELPQEISGQTLLSFVKFQDQSQQSAEFRVNPQSEQFRLLVQGHAVLSLPLCPAPMYIELASQAAFALDLMSKSVGLIPCVDNLSIKAPLGLSVNRGITLLLTKKQELVPTWEFEFFSQPFADHASSNIGNLQSHATGKISLLLPKSVELITTFDRFQRLVGQHHLREFIADTEAQTIGGSLIYKLFARVVNYADYYKGLKYVSAKKHEVLGEVTLPDHDFDTLKDMMCNPLAVDSFMQVAGLHINILRDCADSDAFVCTKVDRIQPGPACKLTPVGAHSWSVYSNYSLIDDKEIASDIFVFESDNKSLVMIILGVHFNRVAISSLTKVLSRLDHSSMQAKSTTNGFSITEKAPQTDQSQMTQFNAGKLKSSSKTALEPESKVSTDVERANVTLNLRMLLGKIMGIEFNGINTDTTLADLGIDSLMMTEVLSEIRQSFAVEVQVEELLDLLDIKSLSDFLQSKQNGDSNATPQSPLVSSCPNKLMSPCHRSLDVGGKCSGSLDSPKQNIVPRLAQMVASYLDTPVPIDHNANLVDLGLDSLLAMELANDIENAFAVKLDITCLNGESSFDDLSNLLLMAVSPTSTNCSTQADALQGTPMSSSTSQTSDEHKQCTSLPMTAVQNFVSLGNVQKAFEHIRCNYDSIAKAVGAANFWNDVYPVQARLVLAYIVEAFVDLGCHLALLEPGDPVPRVSVHSSHGLLLVQLHKILKDASYIISDGVSLLRSETIIDMTPAKQRYHEILEAYPRYASDHRLLHITGSKLAQCLKGTVDPLSLLFRSMESRELMEEVFTNDPMCATTTELLCSFLGGALNTCNGEGQIHILEIGGGTCGTTKRAVEFLALQNIPFTYTFTDISSSLVAAAKRKFAGFDFMHFAVLDVEKPTPEQYTNHFHIVISANCIHATRDVVKSLTNIRHMLRTDGFVSLVEFTKQIYWFDLVYGLLQGWWLFEDGRTHALADEVFWEKSIQAAGFKDISCTGGTSLESRSIRIITAFLDEPNGDIPKAMSFGRKAQFRTETLVYQQTDKNLLCADIYYPAASDVSQGKRPVALMIHGGGHVMLSRKEIRPQQVQLLLDRGLLPVSIDYRLCPEVSLLQGPMVDVCNAFRWARHRLPDLKLDCPGLKVDGEKIVVIGWSSGGHLALTLGWTARLQNIQPPEAILGFYCPIDYEADFWAKPNFPANTASNSGAEYNVLEAVQDKPITSYNIPATARAVHSWIAPSDPRSRLLLHMNWRGQALPILLDGLPQKRNAATANPEQKDWHALPQPPLSQIIPVSPLSQIVRDNYHTPTYLLHGEIDDLVPAQQARSVCDALRAKGVECGLEIVEGKGHLFDCFCKVDDGQDGTGGNGRKEWEAVKKGYEFVLARVGCGGPL